LEPLTSPLWQRPREWKIKGVTFKGGHFPVTTLRQKKTRLPIVYGVDKEGRVRGVGKFYADGNHPAN